MPEAETRNDLPAWIVPIDNSRLILASDGTGFLVDCGSQHIIDTLGQLRASGRLRTIDHVFVTHYHDDHTDQVGRLARMYGASVHASSENRDVLEDPAAYRLPCLTTNPVHVSGRAASGSGWKWKGFEMTLYYFPGQTLHHDALLVTREGEDPVFFIGDSFTPSGIDDYCVLNRNFLHEGTGFLYCLDLIKRRAPRAWLVNQHVRPAFRFSTAQLDQMARTLERRREILRSLFPWDDPDTGLDEGWARFHPYAQAVRPGGTLRCSLRIMNHSDVEQTYVLNLHLPGGWTLPVDDAVPDPRPACRGRGGRDDDPGARQGARRYPGHHDRSAVGKPRVAQNGPRPWCAREGMKPHGRRPWLHGPIEWEGFTSPPEGRDGRPMATSPRASSRGSVPTAVAPSSSGSQAR